MTARECIDKIAKVLSRDITIAKGPEFHVDGSSTTIINPGTDLLDRIWTFQASSRNTTRKETSKND